LSRRLIVHEYKVVTSTVRVGGQRRRTTVNSEELKGKWRQFRGQIKKEWGKLSDDDLNKIEGDYDILIGKIQEKYGTSREEIRRRLDALQASESVPPR
jgi:uncharacterized protein YjbJ (UPF0337 family)